MGETIESEVKNDIIPEPNEITIEKRENINDNVEFTARKGERILPVIPDGGWGWVVVIAAFLVFACADGVSLSFGILLEEFTKDLKTTQSETSFIGSIFVAIPFLTGPLASALVDRYGCRIMTIFAGLLSTFGFLLAALSNSVVVLCLTFGAISGLAMGVLYVTAVVSLAFWFDKKRNLAFSLASCGIGFGTLVYAPTTRYFLNIYGWRDTVVLLAGTLLNMCVCGALMRDPEWLKIKQRTQKRFFKSSNGDPRHLNEEEIIENLLKSGQNPEIILEALTSYVNDVDKIETTIGVIASEERMSSVTNTPVTKQNEKVPPEVVKKLMENERLFKYIMQSYPHLITKTYSEINARTETKPVPSSIEPARLSVEVNAEIPKNILEADVERIYERRDLENEENKHSVHKQCTNSSRDCVMNEKYNKPTQSFRKLLTNHYYLRNLQLHRNTVMHRGAMLTIPNYKLRATSVPNRYRNSMLSVANKPAAEMKWHNRFVHFLKRSFDFRMLTEFHFLMLSLSSLIISSCLMIPYFFLKSYMSQMNVEDGAVMISIIGITCSIGIVELAWAGNQPWMNMTKAYAVCLVICGASVAMYPLCITTPWALGAVSAAFGLSLASTYSCVPTILLELMPVDRFTVAYGMILLSQGIGHLFGPPVGGLLYDLTKSWNTTFYTSGIGLMISGVCVGVVACTKDRSLCGRAPPLEETKEINPIQESSV